MNVTSLVSISLSRYVHVCRSHLYSRLFTLPRTVVTCLLTWLSGLLLAFLPAFDVGGSYHYNPSAHICSLDMGRGFSYPKIVVLLLSAIPVVSVGYFNLAIMRTWKKLSMGLTSRYPLVRKEEKRRRKLAARWRAGGSKKEKSGKHVGIEQQQSSSDEVVQGEQPRWESHEGVDVELRVEEEEEEEEDCNARDSTPKNGGSANNRDGGASPPSSNVEPCDEHQELATNTAADHAAEKHSFRQTLNCDTPASEQRPKMLRTICEEASNSHAELITGEEETTPEEWATTTSPPQTTTLPPSTSPMSPYRLKSPHLITHLHSSSPSSSSSSAFDQPYQTVRSSAVRTGPRSSAVVHAHSLVAVADTPCRHGGRQNPHRHRSIRQLQKRARKDRARESAFVRSLLLVFIFTFMSIVPADVSIIIASSVGSAASPPPVVMVVMVVNMLLFFSGSVSWVVYGLMNPVFRKGYVRCALVYLATLRCAVVDDEVDVPTNSSEMEVAAANRTGRSASARARPRPRPRPRPVLVRFFHRTKRGLGSSAVEGISKTKVASPEEI